MPRYRNRLAALLTINVGLLFAVRAQAGWENRAPFGAALAGDLYTPSSPAASPAILVAIHYCTGNSSSAQSWFQSYADQHGFYIIAPDAGKQCFDSSATRDGDRAAIVNMVDYVIQQKNADPARVFAAGLSSGGCMTNTLLAIYPDVFAGGAAMPGFTAGGWPAGDTTCTKCKSDPPSSDGKYWGDIARNAFSWSGTRPCVQQWVGGGDEYWFNNWLPAVAAQFQDLMGLGGGSSGSGAPSGWTRTVYNDSSGNVRLETNLGPQSQLHDLSSANLWGHVVTFLGLDKPTGACGISAGTGGDSGTGGESGTGGGPADGGSAGTNTGGVNPGGGSNNTGGVATGGAPSGGTNAGGSSLGGAKTGGTPASTGGMPSGGMSTGGATPGGTNAGGTSSGGTSGGGTTPGGTISSGGAMTTGGSVSTGAVTGAGATAAGGTGAGATATTGATTGVAATAATATGGDAAMPPGTQATESDEGCSCSVPGARARGSLLALVLTAGLGMVLGRRRRARRNA